MATAADLLTALREHLVTEGILRRPHEAGDLPPLVLDPEGGPIAPGEMPSRDGWRDHPTLVVNALSGVEATPATFQGFFRTQLVDVRYRSRDVAGRRLVYATDEAVASVLLDRFGWVMGTTHPLLVHQSGKFAGLSPIGYADGVEDWVSRYSFEIPAALVVV